MKPIRNFLTTTIIPIINPDYPFLTNYRQHSAEFDNYFINQYGDLSIDTQLVGASETETQTNISNMIKSALRVNELTLSKLWELTTLDYDPISNYDKTSIITTILDKETTEHSKAKVENTSTNDVVTNTTTSKSGGIDSDTLNTTDIMETVSKGSGADNKLVNKFEENARVDTDTIKGTETDGKRKNVVTERTFGNIGVTTTQQMAQSSIDLYKNFSFYAELFDIVFDAITIPIYACD